MHALSLRKGVRVTGQKTNQPRANHTTLNLLEDINLSSLPAAYRPDIGPKLDGVVHFFEVALEVRDPPSIVHSCICCRGGGLNRAAILRHLDATRGTDKKDIEQKCTLRWT